MMNGARFVGPMIGGGLIAAFGEEWGFGLNALSYFVMIGALALMLACERFSGIAAAELERNGEAYLEEVKEELSRARTALDDYLGTRNSAVS